MKTKILRVSLLILAFSLVIGAAVAMAISANGTADAPEIISQNIEYNENFSLLYAVSKSSVTNPANLVLKVYNKDPNKNNDAAVIRTYDYNSEYDKTAAETNLGVDIYVFKTDGVAATAMLTEIYAQAVETIDGTEYKSAVKKYSVAEYLYERLSDESISADQAVFYNSTIEFGANAQVVIGGATEETPLVTDFSYVTVDGGTVDGYSKGIYLNGSHLDVIKDDVNNTATWKHFYYDGLEAKTVEADSQFTVIDSLKNTFTLSETEIATGIIGGVEDFEEYELGDYTVGWYKTSADGVFKGHNTNPEPKYSYVEDAVHGKVAKIQMNGNQNKVMINRNNAFLSQNEATAYECSFDFKIEMPSIDKFTEPVVRIWLYDEYNNAVTGSSGKYLYVKNTADETTGEVRQELYGNSSYSTKLATADENGWYHLRVVVYKNDNAMYLYFNGSETYQTSIVFEASYSGEISSLCGVAFIQYYKHTSDATEKPTDTYVYIDNIFSGFTMAKK